MHKTILLFFCLLTLTRATAQTDTARPPSAPPDSPIVVRLSHADSVRRDSLARIRRARRDSLRQVRLAAQRDSLAAVVRDSAARALQRDSAARAAQRDSATLAAARSMNDSPRSKINSTPAAPAVPEGPPVEIHQPNSKDSLFYLLLGILFYFALVRTFFEKYFNNVMTLFFRVSLRQQQIREQVLQTPLPSLLLNILFVISGGLYACYLLHYSRFGEGVRFWILYLYCMAILATIYLVKFLVLKFIGWVFSISRATDIYIFVVFLVNKMLGIFLLPFLILITFSGEQLRQILITISLAMVFVLWTYRALAGYRPVRNEIKLAPIYFFLYLCAFEIAPLLLIYKVLLTYLEKMY